MPSWLALATPDPLVPPSGVDENLVTPGVVGFIAFAAVAIAAVLLIIDMVRRVRRVTYRAEIRERLDAEQADQDARGEHPDEPAEAPQERPTT